MLLISNTGISNWKYVHRENSKIMKTHPEKIRKKFDAVSYMREQRDRLSNKLAGLSKEEVVAYFLKQKLTGTTKTGG